MAGTLASVLLCRLTGSPFHCWPLVPFCWVPFVVALEGARPYEAVKLGLLQGTLLNAAAFTWLPPALVKTAGVSWPGAAVLFSIFALAQGGRMALLAACVALSGRARLSAAAVFPISLVAAELVYPYVFPWQVAIFTCPVVAWMQLAEYGGPLVLSLWVGVANASFASAWLHRRSGFARCFRRLTGGCLVVLGVTIAGRYLIESRRETMAASTLGYVAIIQGNVGVSQPAAADLVAVYRRATRELLSRSPPVDLVVWPETAFSQPTPDSQLRTTLRDYVLHDENERVPAALTSTPLLLGMVLQADGSDRRGSGAPLANGSLTNSAVLSDGHGRVLGRYDKRELVPFGEQDALASIPVIRDVLRAVTLFSPGILRAPMSLNGRRLGISICYEDILRDSFRESVQETRPELLVNLTSDSWFAGSAAPELHLALASLRAVEHRRYLVRATNTGVSAIIDPTGKIAWRLPENTVAAAVAPVRFLVADTLYERFGDLPWKLGTGACGLGLLLRAMRSRREEIS